MRGLILNAKTSALLIFQIVQNILGLYESDSKYVHVDPPNPKKKKKKKRLELA